MLIVAFLKDKILKINQQMIMIIFMNIKDFYLDKIKNFIYFYLRVM